MPHESERGSSVRWPLIGGLVAGTFDITYACTFWGLKAGVRPTRILQSVASGLLGPAAFEGGAGTAALGLGLHYFIAITMALVFWLVARRRPALVDRPVVTGSAYGVLLYLIMNLVVVPLSQAKPSAKDPLWVGLSVAVHMFLIGVPIALASRRALRGPQR